VNQAEAAVHATPEFDVQIFACFLRSQKRGFLDVFIKPACARIWACRPIDNLTRTGEEEYVAVDHHEPLVPGEVSHVEDLYRERM
jgi:hypothetical protein